MRSPRPARLTLCVALLTAVAGTTTGPAAPSLAAGPRTVAAATSPALLGTLAGPSQAAMYPSGVTVDPVNDRLVVADTGRDRVLFYSYDGRKLGGFGEYGTGPGQLASPRDVAVDDQGRIYVADAENNRVQAFTSTGVFRWERGGLGTGPTTLNTPIGVSWDHAQDVLLVASTGQSLVKAWDADGVFQWRSPTGTTLGAGAIRDVDRGPDGRIWLSAYKQHQVKAYDVSPDGLTWDTTPAIVLGDGAAAGDGDGQLNFPYNVAFSPDARTVYVADTGNGRVARWDLSVSPPRWLPPVGAHCAAHPQPCPDPPAGSGTFNHLRRVAVAPDGTLVAADFWGGGLELFDPSGASLRSIEGAEPPAPGFAEPYSVDVAASGDVYVMDRLNHRIERFDATGAYLGKVGARGTSPGTFSWPEGLTTGPDGSVWAVDTRGDRVTRFPRDLDPRRVPSWGSTGSDTGQLSYPSGADVAPDGSVWVADTRNDRLQVLDPASGTWRVVGSAGTGPGQLQRPAGVAVTASAVYVADTGNDRVQVLRLDGTPLGSWSTGLSGPEGVEVAPDGTLWVADTQHHRVVHLSADLASDLGDVIGAPGSGVELAFPHDVAVGGGRIYVADTYHDRVLVLDDPGADVPGGPVDPAPGTVRPVPVGELSASGGHAPLYPAGLAVEGGRWLVSDSGGGRVVAVDPVTGAVDPLPDSGLTDPRDLAVDPVDPTRHWVVDTGAGRVVAFDPSGTPVASIGGLTQPHGMAIGTDAVYVADTYANRVLAATRDGATRWTQQSCGGTAFSRPRDVGLLGSQLVVADTDNDRLVVLDAATGACVRVIGKRGTAPGTFRAPRSVSADGSGGLWVADALNQRLQHLTATGAVIGTTPVGAYGDGPAQFRSPHCVTALPGGQVAVCDTFGWRISVWDGTSATPSPVRLVGGTAPAPGGFNGPFAAAYGPDGSLYAVDWFNHRVQRWGPDGRWAGEWGHYGTAAGSLIFPRGVVVSPAGEVVVTDSENNRLVVYTATGDVVRTVRPTSGPALNRPHQTALDGTTTWVADTGRSRVVRMAADGSVLTSFAVPGPSGGSRPEGIAVDVDGTILVSNTRASRVERWSRDGQLLEVVTASGSGAGQVRSPSGLLVTGQGATRRLWIADSGNDRVVVLDAADAVETTFGGPGSGPAGLDTPRSVALDPTTGRLAVTDLGGDRITLWDPTGGEEPPAPDTTAPSVVVTSPAAGTSTPNPVLVTGTATDDRAVAEVSLAVQDTVSKAWLRPDGSWGAFARRTATLLQPSAPETGWTTSLPPLPPGRYAVAVRVTDLAGNTPATAVRSTFVVTG